MINSLIIKNFQSHKHSILEFSPGVNIIIGSSDSGKSGIMRTLRWLNYGLKGDGFRPLYWEGETDCEMEIVNKETNEIVKIQKIRSNTKNQYILKEGTKLLEFNAIGKDIPEEIFKILNMDLINMQPQKEQFFLIDKSSGDVALHFNRMAQLEKIDIGLKSINGSVKKLEQDITYKTDELTTLQTKFKTFSYLEDLETKISSMEEMDKEKEFNQIIKEKISGVLLKIEKIEEDSIIYNTLVEAEKPVLLILSLFDNKKVLEGQKNQLQARITSIQTLSNKIVIGEKFIKAETSINSIITLFEEFGKLNTTQEILLDICNKLHGIDDEIKELEGITGAEEGINIILKHMEAVTNMQKGASKIKRPLNILRNLDEEEKQITEELKENEKLYHDNFPDECPLCKANIKH